MLLEAKKLDKSFNGVYALKGLDLSLKEGEIHGLVGENGAGKSTFIKILGGVYTKNGGELSWNGAPFPADFGPVESRELGINIIFQDHVLIPAFSALENIWLGRPYPRKGGLIQWKEMEKAAQKKGEELGIHLDLKKSIFQMTPAQKKCVEILRAMMSDCKLMILDEPTASLSDKETNLLFSIYKEPESKRNCCPLCNPQAGRDHGADGPGNSAEKRRTGKYLRYCLYQPEGAGPADEREWGSG